MITSDLGGKKYVLGRGRAFFDRFANGITVDAATQGEGERYIGNTPSFNTNSSSEDLEHFDADAGVNTKDDSVQLSLDRAGAFVTDNVDDNNVALMFLGAASTIAQAAASGLTSAVTANRGRFYQLGATGSLPAGVRNVANVVCAKGAGFVTPVAALNNFEVDEDLGRVYVLPGAPDIPDGTDVQFTFDTLASNRTQVVSSSNAIYGALRFVANNPKGENKDYYFPYVKLAPDGDFELKGESWQEMSFTFEILKKASNIESAYVDGRGTLV